MRTPHQYPRGLEECPMRSDWTPTEDTLYSHSEQGHRAIGDKYPWMGAEEVEGVWFAFLYVISEPRNELGDFSFDIFPDNDDHMYTLVGGKVCRNQQAAFDWCQQIDNQQKETVMTNEFTTLLNRITHGPHR